MQNSMKYVHTFDQFLHESKKEPVFLIGDQVIIANVGGSSKKYNGLKGIVSSNPMQYSNGTYSYMVKVGRREIEFRETELQSI